MCYSLEIGWVITAAFFLTVSILCSKCKNRRGNFYTYIKIKRIIFIVSRILIRLLFTNPLRQNCQNKISRFKFYFKVIILIKKYIYVLHSSIKKKYIYMHYFHSLYLPFIVYLQMFLLRLFKIILIFSDKVFEILAKEFNRREHSYVFFCRL